MILQNNPDSSLLPFLLFLAVISAIVAVQYRLRVLRRREMEALAARRGLQFLECRVPAEFFESSQRETLFWHNPRNVVFGRADGDLILAFDADIHYRRGRDSHTVVARRWEVPPLTPRLGKGLHCSHRGRWRTVTLERSLFVRLSERSPAMIEDVWRRLETRSAYRSTRVASPPTSSEIFIHPRWRQPTR